MGEYLLLFRGAESETRRQSPEQWQEHMELWADWMGGLSREGKFLGAQPLNANGKVVTGKKKIISDGPFMEGKEMVGGYLILKVDTYDEAVRIAGDCPILAFDDGSVEVREIQEMMMR